MVASSIGLLKLPTGPRHDLRAGHRAQRHGDLGAVVRWEWGPQVDSALVAGTSLDIFRCAGPRTLVWGEPWSSEEKYRRYSSRAKDVCCFWKIFRRSVPRGGKIYCFGWCSLWCILRFNATCLRGKGISWITGCLRFFSLAVHPQTARLSLDRDLA